MPQQASTVALPPLPRLHEALLGWYDRHRRDLPWRGMRDPYAILVSEVMLQQTRVETVIPYFLRWMERFPTAAHLAAAPEEEVLRNWAGLGYYARARNLHRAAQAIADRGGFPVTREALAALPGIGAYTSGAIASIAFDEQVPAVDGNVLRVLARLLGDGRDIRDVRTRRAFDEVAKRLVPRHRPGDWNQALMELGATVCTPRAPDCSGCPVAADCHANATGRVHELPVARPKPLPRADAMHFAWIEHEGAVLLVRGATGGLLQGLWGLPGGPRTTTLDALVAEQTGFAVRPGPVVAAATHRFTHRLWSMDIHRATIMGTPAPASAVRWVDLAALTSEAVSTAHRKAIAAVLRASSA